MTMSEHVLVSLVLHIFPGLSVTSHETLWLLGNLNKPWLNGGPTKNQTQQQGKYMENKKKNNFLVNEKN